MHIKFDSKIIIFVLFFFILDTEEIYLLLLIFTIIHELCHLIMGVLLGFQPSKICIMPFGTYLGFRINVESHNKKILKGNICVLKKLLVAFAGPFSNILIASIFLIKNDYIVIAYINVLIAIFNLLPIYPLDGGRIVKQLLILLFGRQIALKYTNFVSNIALVIVIVLSFIFCIMSKSLIILTTLIYLVYIRKKEDELYRLKQRAYIIVEKYRKNNLDIKV